tara:strand:- start:1748 stop:1855 length:108 start_codon:yes stop_codon:yes gene_type:complete
MCNWYVWAYALSNVFILVLIVHILSKDVGGGSDPK